MKSTNPIAVLFRFPFPGPWRKDLAEHAKNLASDIAQEPGLIWKIWLEDRESGHTGGVYLFADAAAAQRYREKHERRLAAMGHTGVAAQTFEVNVELSILTLASAALGQSTASTRGLAASLAAES